MKFRKLQIFVGCEFSQPAKLPTLRTVQVSTLLIVPSCCPFDFLTFVPLFGFLPILSPVIAFYFGFFFCNFSWLEQYISSYCTVIGESHLFLINKVFFRREPFSSSRFFSFSSTFSYFLSFLAAKYPHKDDNSRNGWLNPLHP